MVFKFSQLHKDAKDVAGLPERKQPEHLYEYIERTYGNTINSRISGLPGYTPPTIVRVLNGLTYLSASLWVYSTLSLICLICLYIGCYLIESVSTVTFYLPNFLSNLFGYELVSFYSFSIVVTPLFAMSVLWFGLVGLSGLIERLSRFMSQPYEEKYRNWLNEIKPTNSAGYPPSYQYLYTESTLPNPPEDVAPTVCRERRTTEKIAYQLEVLLVSITSVMYTVLLFQMGVGGEVDVDLSK